MTTDKRSNNNHLKLNKMKTNEIKVDQKALNMKGEVMLSCCHQNSYSGLQPNDTPLYTV